MYELGSLACCFEPLIAHAHQSSATLLPFILVDDILAMPHVLLKPDTAVEVTVAVIRRSHGWRARRERRDSGPAGSGGPDVDL